jgi:hypothetical protein
VEAKVWLQSLQSAVAFETAIQVQERAMAVKGDGVGSSASRIFQKDCAAFIIQKAATLMPSVNQVPPYMQAWAVQLSTEFVELQKKCSEVQEAAAATTQMLNKI